MAQKKVLLTLFAILWFSQGLLCKAEVGQATLGQLTSAGSCGYYNGNDTYGVNVAGASTLVYHQADSCGACYSLQCVNSTACRLGGEVTVTVTSVCSSTNTSSPCDPGKKAFNLSPASFDQLVTNKAVGIIPINFTRVPCLRTGGVQFTVIAGNDYYLALLIQNVAGPGALFRVHLSANRGPWVPMRRVYGSVWSLNGVPIVGKALSIRLTAFPKLQRVIIWDALPPSWAQNVMYNSTVNFPQEYGRSA